MRVKAIRFTSIIAGLLVVAGQVVAGPPADWQDILASGRSAARATSGESSHMAPRLIAPAVRRAVDVETDTPERQAEAAPYLARAEARRVAAEQALGDGRYLEAARLMELARLSYEHGRRIRASIAKRRSEALERLAEGLPSASAESRSATADTGPSRAPTGKADWKITPRFRSVWSSKDRPAPLDAPTVVAAKSAVAIVAAKEREENDKLDDTLQALVARINAINQEVRDRSLATRLTFGGGVVRGDAIPFAAVRLALDSGSVIGGTTTADGLMIAPRRVSRLGLEVGASVSNESLARRSNGHVTFLGLSYLFTSQIGLSAGAAHHDADVYPYGAVSISLDSLAF